MGAEVVSPNQGKSRTDLALATQGIISENFPRQGARGDTSIMVDGTVYYMSVGLRAGDIAAAVSVYVTVIGITPTLSKVGLYSKAGVLLASSAELGAVWTTGTGQKTSVFSTAYTVPADDGYYVGLVCKASTLPTLVRGNANTGASGAAVGTGVVAFGSETGKSDLPAPGVIGTPSIAFLVAVS